MIYTCDLHKMITIDTIFSEDIWLEIIKLLNNEDGELFILLNVSQGLKKIICKNLILFLKNNRYINIS